MKIRKDKNVLLSVIFEHNLTCNLNNVINEFAVSSRVSGCDWIVKKVLRLAVDVLQLWPAFHCDGLEVLKLLWVPT